MTSGRNAIVLALGLAALVAGCAQEELPQSVYDSRQPPTRQASSPQGADATADASAGAGNADSGTGVAPSGMGRPDAGPSGSGQCVQAIAESLPARIRAMTSASASGGAAPADQVVTTDFIYGKLWDIGYCGKCHTGTNVYYVKDGAGLADPGLEGFATKGEEALAHIRGAGATPMPPIDPNASSGWGVGGPNRMKFVDEVGSLLDAWVNAKEPPVSFTIQAAAATPATDAGGAADGGAPATYLMAPAVGNGMTNLGNCIPAASIVATEQALSTARDDMFARLKKVDFGEGTPADVIGLPEKLSDTDLTTFDGETLARMGVIAFSPQYPLWSDDAGKVRHVRVPRGKSIYFDKTKQEFRIPENTRFYKTFLKKIVDTDGNQSWRKIETRLIVSRGDTANGPAAQVNALYGSYLWKEDESDAVLLGSGHAPPDLIVSATADSLLKDNEGFTDTVLAYETDANTHATRHYAVPSSTRCVQCHMGSPSQSFVLGFRPVQLLHRPVGQGGVIEPSGPDEMDLLQRLIDYGIVTGIASIADDVLPLEQSEGMRLPRNDKELTAQAYMLGNCVHCHNPRGFPSVTFPVLNDVAHLSFLPGQGDTDGIFQFPLEKFSPRITRGIRGDVPIPYITPSLLDNPSFPPSLDPNLGDTSIQASGGIWEPKWAGSPGVGFVYAPWRSLIYRNVDTPFTYTDDLAIYPHMPVNTPGYDLRAKQIMGDWMVSIPSIRKRPELDEYGQPYPSDSTNGFCGSDTAMCLEHVRTATDDSPQPYVEVKPDAPGYGAAFAAAQQRLAAFHLGQRIDASSDETFIQNRYAESPDVDDIVDPSVDPVCQPTPSVLYENPLLNIPTHPHWVPIDLTLAQGGDWVPRRPDWMNVFTQGVPAVGTSSCLRVDATTAKEAQQSQQCVLDMLGGLTCALNPAPNGDPVTLDKAIRDFATTPLPMGLWKANAACDWSQEPWKSHGPTVADARAVNPHPHWLDGPGGADPALHVDKETPGEAVFGMICINCHGPNADSHGRLADNLATMTGGNALVADLRDGLFGPQASPGANRSKVFTDDDTAAHYMAWMALGGTQVIIPPSFLTIIGQTPFFGAVRSGLDPPRSANMLSVARSLCMAALAYRPFDLTNNADYYTQTARGAGGTPLLFDNFDAELWLRLCSIHNPLPVIPYALFGSSPAPIPEPYWEGGSARPIEDPLTQIIPPAVLLRCAFESGGCRGGGGLPTFQVGDERGAVFPSLSEDNLHPWCILAPRIPANDSGTQTWLQTYCLGGTHCSNGKCSGAYPDTNCVYAPVCPVHTEPLDAFAGEAPAWDDAKGTAALNWAQRGAINAGLAVFLYLNSITTADPLVHYTPSPPYDQCTLLTK